jgi:hypothetical protein
MEHWQSETESYRDRIGDLYEVLNLVTPAFAQLPSTPLNCKPSDRTALKYELCLLTIGTARSAQELLSSISLLSITGKFLAASVCVRLIIELWGVLAYAETKVLTELERPERITHAQKRLVRLIYGSKSGVAPFVGEHKVAAINVMEFVRAADELAPGLYQTYEFLCDSAHPTYGQHGYLLFSGSEYDNWSNTVFADRAHSILVKTVEAAEVGIRGIAESARRIFFACLPEIIEEVGGS